MMCCGRMLAPPPPRLLSGSPHTHTVREIEPMRIEDAIGRRFWVFNPCAYTSVADINSALCSFPVVVFSPRVWATNGAIDASGMPSTAPVVIILQGLCAPMTWSRFLVTPLLALGVAVMLVELPLAGQRSAVRSATGNPAVELIPLLRLGVTVDTGMLVRLFEVRPVPPVASIPNGPMHVQRRGLRPCC